MTQDHLPLILEPHALQASLGRDDLLIVDLSQSSDKAHIPGAIHVDYTLIIDSKPPASGLMPGARRLEALFSSLGLDAGTHVVAYDDEGGGKACRLLWTLDAIGHRRYSLLNGGLDAWQSEHHPCDTRSVAASSQPCTVHINQAVIADKGYILAHLHDTDVVILDCRSAEEYSGQDNRARRGGHIPGAIHIEWTRAVDPSRHLRLKGADELHALYQGAGVTPDKEIIVYCHSHRRSAFSYVALKSLGYTRLRGYPGSWSEWGNAPDTPIEM